MQLDIAREIDVSKVTKMKILAIAKEFQSLANNRLTYVEMETKTIDCMLPACYPS